ncbi:MAG: phosphoribosylglycinamide formyltransferase [Lactobacillus sp.]|jgi:phosphoribosylglycinamide formyltransferase-1|nr:phosphoribosylglycinamide formyltransferase [Lactobacillus sp.]MCI2031805.1 phosphoribosylglycinamide formyltransferase [Lactobacillus sp.]
MKHIVVFASGDGSNFAALARYFESGRHGVTIDLLICDHQDAYVLTRAADFGIPSLTIDYHEFATKAAAEAYVLAQLPPCDLLVLAGFMRIVGPTLLAAFPDQIVNLHPALLPSFPGRNGIQDAYAYGVKVTGVTVHYVDAGIDSGRIIAQEPVRIQPEMSLAELVTAIHAVEHDLLPKTVADLLTKERIA